MGIIGDGLRIARALVRLLPDDLVPRSAVSVSPGDDGAVNGDSTVVTVDFLRASRLRLPVEPPSTGAQIITFTRPQAVVLMHPSAAR